MWKKTFDQLLPLLGHRNWILIVDKAFPLQTADGIITLDTGLPLKNALLEVLKQLKTAQHIKPVVYTDLELLSMNDELCPGAERVRQDLKNAFQDASVQTLPHEGVFTKIDAASKLFKIVVLKTESLVPYSSVFIELDCGYWSAEKEQALRAKMKL